MIKKLYVVIIVFAVLLCVFMIYQHPPNHSKYYPKCVFKQITSFECAGCGSARAVYALLHGDLKSAANYNLLLMILIPMGIIACLLRIKNMNGNIARLFTKPLFYLVLILVFWILRNVNYFPFTYLHSDK